jgi:hypothetical protein
MIKGENKMTTKTKNHETPAAGLRAKTNAGTTSHHSQTPAASR